MTEKHHPEYLYKPNGEHRVYLSDEFRNPIPTQGLKGTFTITYDDGRKEEMELRASPGGTYLVAAGRRKVPAGTQVRINLTARGEEFFMDFAVPESMTQARPDPVGWSTWVANGLLALLGLAGLFIIFRPPAGGSAAGRGPQLARRVAAAVPVLAVTVALFYVANAMVIPRWEEARAMAQAPPPHAHPPAVASAAGAVKLDPQTQAALGLKIETAEETARRRSLTALGRVTPRTGAVGEVFAPVAGRAIAHGRLPSIGDFVKAGQSLLTVEPVLTVPEKTSLASEEYRVATRIAEAESDMKHAQLDYQRAERLYELKAISQKDLQHAKLTYENAKTTHEGALKQRDLYRAAQPGAQNTTARYPVRAPISGVVAFAEAANGEFVTPTKRLFTIMDLSSVWVQAQVYEKDLPDVLKAARATFQVDAFPDETFTGRLKAVSPQVQEATRTVDVIFEAPNSGLRLRAGMAAKVFIESGEAVRSVTVPASAVLDDEGRPVLYVVVNGDEFVRREVQTGPRAQGRVEIKEGLMPGEAFVAQGGYQIRAAATRATLTGDGHAGHTH